MTLSTELRGAVMGRGYRLERRLGPGADSAFEATHERLPGRLVVRLFPQESLGRSDASARLQRGASLGSLLRDAQAIQILDFSLPGETPAFVVTEWVDGRSLTAVMAEDGMLAPPATADIVVSIALALAAGHKLGLTHGDLRPSHVLLPGGVGPRAKVGGFGWAKEFRAVARHPAPLGFLAPEQHLGKVLTLDPRVDQFGLAVLGSEMLAGCLPCSEEHGDAHGRGGRPRLPSPLGELVRGVPAAMDDVIRRALAPAPTDRFDDVLQFAARLREASGGGPRKTISAGATTAPKRTVRGVGRGTSSVPRVPAALPTTAAGDITEEMDLQTLSPLVARADSGGNVSSRIQNEESLDLDLLNQVAYENGYEVEISVEPVSTDGGGRAKSAVSAVSPPPPPHPGRFDEAQTQIRRSPFLPPLSPTVASSPAFSPPAVAEADALDELSLRPTAMNLGPAFDFSARLPTTEAYDAQARFSLGSGSSGWRRAAWTVAVLAVVGGGVVLWRRRWPPELWRAAATAATAEAANPAAAAPSSTNGANGPPTPPAANPRAPPAPTTTDRK
jgi:serine/threonine protein kinase